ncbi:MAG: response regulator transcription factor [Chloroflexi bacterium]|nr:response regulator transcription factor [Chloroflexota bacterium]
MEALLRRTHQGARSSPPIFDDGVRSIDLRTGRVQLRGQIIELSSHELSLLSCLVHNEGAVAPRERLPREVWGTSHLDITLTAASLLDHISHLRQKLGDNPESPRYIHAASNTGYWFGPSHSSSLCQDDRDCCEAVRQ